MSYFVSSCSLTATYPVIVNYQTVNAAAVHSRGWQVGISYNTETGAVGDITYPDVQVFVSIPAGFAVGSIVFHLISFGIRIEINFRRSGSGNTGCSHTGGVFGCEAKFYLCIGS